LPESNFDIEFRLQRLGNLREEKRIEAQVKERCGVLLFRNGNAGEILKKFAEHSKKP